MRQGLFGPVAGLLGGGHVYLLGPFGGIGLDRHLVVEHFHEPARHHDALLVVALCNPQLAHVQHRQQGRMVRQYTHLPINRRRDYHIHVIVFEHHPLGGDDLQPQGHGLLLSPPMWQKVSPIYSDESVTHVPGPYLECG